MTVLHRPFFFITPGLRLRALAVAMALLTAVGPGMAPPLAAETPEAEVQGLDSANTAGSNALRLVFQGRLEESGEPAQRAYDFVFRLFSESEGGLQVGPALSVDDL